jgi:hypothetical protein
MAADRIPQRRPSSAGSIPACYPGRRNEWGGVQIPGGHFLPPPCGEICAGRLHATVARLTNRCSCQARDQRKPLRLAAWRDASAAERVGRILSRSLATELQRYAADGRYASASRTMRPCAGPEGLWGLLALDHARQGPGIARDSLDGCAARRHHARSDSRRLPGTGSKWELLAPRALALPRALLQMRRRITKRCICRALTEGK